MSSATSSLWLPLVDASPRTARGCGSFVCRMVLVKALFPCDAECLEPWPVPLRKMQHVPRLPKGPPSPGEGLSRQNHARHQGQWAAWSVSGALRRGAPLQPFPLTRGGGGSHTWHPQGHSPVYSHVDRGSRAGWPRAPPPTRAPPHGCSSVGLGRVPAGRGLWAPFLCALMVCGRCRLWDGASALAPGPSWSGSQRSAVLGAGVGLPSCPCSPCPVPRTEVGRRVGPAWARPTQQGGGPSVQAQALCSGLTPSQAPEESCSPLTGARPPPWPSLPALGSGRSARLQNWLGGPCTGLHVTLTVAPPCRRACPG